MPHPLDSRIDFDSKGSEAAKALRRLADFVQSLPPPPATPSKKFFKIHALVCARLAELERELAKSRPQEGSAN